MSANRDVRNQRNLAEKQRRDKLNGYINELGNLVPMVTMSTKRLDKTSVLRLSAAYLRLNKTALTLKRSRHKKSQTSSQLWRPQKFTLNHFKDLLEAVEGFIVVTTGHGKIIYVSQSVENFLGHQNIDMIGHSLTSFLHPSDIESVYIYIQRAYDQVTKGYHTSDKISFQCRIREKNQPRSEVLTYQMVRVSGHMTSTECGDSVKENDSQCPEDLEKGDEKSGMNILFKGFIQIIPTNPMSELSLMDANLDEYVTRHLLDGTLIYTDHRISNIIGYLPDEVIGKSAYDFILNDDHSIALFAQKLMLSNSNGTGIIVHRLKTRANKYVFLQSSGCLQYDKTTGQIDHFVCVSRLLIEDEGDKERDKFVKRFTPHINNISPTSLYESLQVLIGPRSKNNDANGKPVNSSVQIEEVLSPQSQSQTPVFNNVTSSESPEKIGVQPQTTPENEVQIIGEQTANCGTYVTQLNSIDVTQTQPTRHTALLQIHTLPILPVTSAQIITQQQSPNLSVNKCNNTSNITTTNVNNLIGIYAPTVSLSYINSNINANAGAVNLNTGTTSAINCASTSSTPYICSTAGTSRSTDLTHLLGATVLHLDSRQQPVLSVYKPHLTTNETLQYFQRQPYNSNNNIDNNTNSMSPNLKTNGDLGDTFPMMDTSFYTDLNSDELVNEIQCGQFQQNSALHIEEFSNTSTENLANFSFDKGMDCEITFGDDQFMKNVLKDQNVSKNDYSLMAKSSDNLVFDQIIDINSSISLQNSEPDFFASTTST